MRVLIAGSSGVIGRQLLPALVAAGHQVVGMARTHGGATQPDGVPTVVVDALDADAVVRAVDETEPDAIVNMLTAIPAAIDPRHMINQFRLTNRLRTEGTRNLIAAASAVGVRRLISQGLAWGYDPGGGSQPADEEAALWPDPPEQFAPNLAALIELERRTTDAGGIVLRLGHLYGPGTIYAHDGSFTQQVRDRKVPLVGSGRSIFSFIHAQDVADAVAAGLVSDHCGVFNIVDDEPAMIRDWLPVFAARVGAPRPRHVPAVLARMAAGRFGVAYMTRLRGASNARARELLAWQPRHPSWRTTLGMADPDIVPSADDRAVTAQDR